MTTHVIKVKCMNCGLHFAAYSWNEGWEPFACPECGQYKDRFMVWRDTSDQHIFELVPGDSPLTDMGPINLEGAENG